MSVILIVEDNAIFRCSLKEILSRRFPATTIHEACDGSQALQRMGACVPDLVFMDIRLPGVNGLELTKTIKKHYQDAVVVILTSYDLPEYREAAYRSGANHFLTKGVATSEEIMSLVESVLPIAPVVGGANAAGNGAAR